MNRALLLAAMLLALLILSACGLLNRGTTIQPIDVPEVRTGTQGVVAEFLENSPPSQTTEGVPLVIRFSLHNQGAADVLNGLYAAEVNPGAFMLLDNPTDGAFDVSGKSQTDPVGQKQFYVVNGFASALPARQETTTERVTLHYCYPYKTIASTPVCVDTDIGGQTQTQKICTEQKVTTSGGQGGPITLESVHLKSIPLDEFRVRPQLTIEIANRGNGEVMQTRDAYSICLGQAATTANEVQFRAFLSEQPLQCAPAQVRFRENKATVVCTLESGFERQLGTFQAVFRAEMDYGYHQRITKNVEIRKVTT